jgi:catechol 2,3-dioxygenase-like lactoylglutathione lyase family enzyme
MLIGATTVFVVADIVASIAHYRDTLGFERSFEFGEPVFYAGFCRDAMAIELISSSKTQRLPGIGAICIEVDDVDAIHAELVRRGTKILGAPVDSSYGMRDFNVVDLDGNQLTFGMALAEK